VDSTYVTEKTTKNNDKKRQMLKTERPWKQLGGTTSRHVHILWTAWLHRDKCYISGCRHTLNSFLNYLSYINCTALIFAQTGTLTSIQHKMEAWKCY